MEIKFRTKKIQQLCEKSLEAVKKLGPQNARKLFARLSEIEAASSVSDLVNGAPHELTGDRAGQFAVSLSGGYRLVFSPDSSPSPVKPDGGIDWSSVTIICIEYIGDYHE